MLDEREGDKLRLTLGESDSEIDGDKLGENETEGLSLGEID